MEGRSHQGQASQDKTEAVRDSLSVLHKVPMGLDVSLEGPQSVTSSLTEPPSLCPGHG